jgi:hypothetical protein
MRYADAEGARRLTLTRTRSRQLQFFWHSTVAVHSWPSFPRAQLTP